MLRALHDEGQTILLTTHYMEEAEALCDRVAVVDHGNVLASGTIDELKDSAGADTVITVRYEGAVPGSLALAAMVAWKPGPGSARWRPRAIRCGCSPASPTACSASWSRPGPRPG